MRTGERFSNHQGAAKDAVSIRGGIAKLAVLAGYIFLLAAVVVPISGPDSEFVQNMRVCGLGALAGSMISIAIMYRKVKSIRRYYFTTFLLIFAIICSTASWWVAITAPVWSVILMVNKKRWFGPVIKKPK
jgi:hypothetical protein